MRDEHAEYIDHFVESTSVESGPASANRAVLARLERASEEFLNISRDGDGSPETVLHPTAAAMHQFAAAAAACERAGLSRSDLGHHLEPLRALFAQSPLVRRLQTWPRGYPGDFETVEWLCDATNRAGAAPLPWAIEHCALQSPVAQQHRNKVGLQARTILSTVLDNPKARVASIGCGGARDLSLIEELVPPTHGSFVLLDADADALAFARGRLSRLSDRCEFVRGRVPRGLTKLRGNGGFDLIVAGGLFDYLPDSWAVATLSAMHTLLRPNGRVFFSNMARGNPFRLWIEYLADWRLIERDEADMRRLLGEAGFDPGRIRVFRDSTELALMVDARGSRPLRFDERPADVEASATRG